MYGMEMVYIRIKMTTVELKPVKYVCRDGLIGAHNA